MKQFKVAKQILGLVALTMLTACGGNDDYLNGNYYNSLAEACGSQLPQGSVYQQTVRGLEANGGTLDLLIYGDGSGSIGAIGEINIPSLDDIGIFTNNLNGNYYDPNYYNNNNNYGNNLNGGLISSGQLRTCVSTNGISGYMQRDGTADQVNIQLQGNNVSLVPDGSSYAVPTLNNQYIDGDWILTINGSGSAQLSF